MSHLKVLQKEERRRRREGFPEGGEKKAERLVA